MTPQAIFEPELPEGWVVKSSGALWMRMVLPMISQAVNRSVRNTENA